MSNYTKSTNFATKDNLTSGNPLKIVKGTEIDTEFNNIATAVATKADLTSPTFTGTPTLPTGTIAVTQSTANSSTAVATTAFVQAVLATLHPVGSIYINATNSTNPATLLGFGTWTAFGAGRVMVGFDSGNALFDVAEETGGSANATLPTHTHTATSTVTDPSHVHSYTYKANVGGTTAGGDPNSVSNTTSTTASAVTGVTVATSIASAGSSGTDANYQPYITVYLWKRTA
jgi:hypothetical protein